MKKERETQLLLKIGTYIFNSSLILLFAVPWLTKWSLALKVLLTCMWGFMFGLLFLEASKRNGEKKK